MPSRQRRRRRLQRWQSHGPAYDVNADRGGVTHTKWERCKEVDRVEVSGVRQGLLEVEGALMGSSRTEKDCSWSDKDWVTLLLRSEPRNLNFNCKIQ